MAPRTILETLRRHRLYMDDLCMRHLLLVSQLTRSGHSPGPTADPLDLALHLARLISTPIQLL
jgi:hypothetical protein